MSTPPPAARGWRSLHLAALVRAAGLAGARVTPGTVQAPREHRGGGVHAALPSGAVRPLLVAPGVPATQTDATTCGAAVLTILAADGDPAVQRWLEEGAPGTAGRFGALQHAAHRASRTGACGLRTWPAAWGTPPWGAARAARWGTVRYTHRVVDDGAPDDLGPVRRAVDAALDAGIPVPVFVGGDLGQGVTRAVPRHVVLLGSRHGDRYTVYEPSAGLLHGVEADGLWSGERRAAALGGWTHVTWVLLPR